ncbi:MAG: pyruvate:ferredoxin (flavodoxin) oxidoreductase, partial [Planctomycetota bacterium]
DMALIAQAATLETRLPFIHFFDGFRTSNEIQKIEALTTDDMKAMVDQDLVAAHRARGMRPEDPIVRGTSQNPDVYFQGRETVNPYYVATPDKVQAAMDRFAKLVGREYHLFDYVGAPDAERVVVVMGSGADVMHETVEKLAAEGEKVGVVKVRLYRPFSARAFLDAIPDTCQSIAVLDRTKEPGSAGEPLYQDVQTALFEAVNNGERASLPIVVGGRYGLGSKEFTPAMGKAVLDNLDTDRPRNHFTIGIKEDVTNSSLDYDAGWSTETDAVKRALFFGLGSDGTVGATKNTCKIIGKGTDYFAQNYAVYDSKKAGAITISHVRFSPERIRSAYLIGEADFVGCNSEPMLFQYDMVGKLKQGGIFLLNSIHGADKVFDTLPRQVQEQLIAKQARFYVLDGYDVANKVGLGGRINVIMQTAYFKLAGILPEDKAQQMIEDEVSNTYGKKGDKIVEMNIEASRQALAHLHEVTVPQSPTSDVPMATLALDGASDFVRDVTAPLIQGLGDELPVSKMPADGTFPTATTQFEKRCIALNIPDFDPSLCIQCGMCAMVCPHSVVRIKAYDPKYDEGAPAGWTSLEAKGKGLDGKRFIVQVSPEDCTGCAACAHICPGKAKDDSGKKALTMVPIGTIKDREAPKWEHFKAIPYPERTLMDPYTLKGSQLLQPLFEFSGACAGCGETPVVRLATQLFGDRSIMANATGCSSIYGGNLPTTPYCKRADGCGPTWSNSLFEDCAEFGLGMRLSVDALTHQAVRLLDEVGAKADPELAKAIKDADLSTHDAIEEQRARIAQMRQKVGALDTADAKTFLSVIDYLVPKVVWAVGGDGWAYDIGYGGLDHALASGRNLNVLVLDTGVYSNTGGQASKATPRGAVAKFAASGKTAGRKDLGMMAMTYGSVYVAQIALGANPMQAIKAIKEAVAYNGPSLIIAYTHCIAHGINMTVANDLQKEAVKNGFWPLYRYNPDLIDSEKGPLTLDSKAPDGDLGEFYYKQNRFLSLQRSKPERAAMLLEGARRDVEHKWKELNKLLG